MLCRLRVYRHRRVAMFQSVSLPPIGGRTSTLYGDRGKRMNRLTARMRRNTFALVLSIIAGLLLSLIVPAGTSYADDPPIVNLNKIDWTVETVFFDQHGEDLPLRTGQHDFITSKGQRVNGFGSRHIEDRHTVVPPSFLIQETVQNPEFCSLPSADRRIRCLNTDVNPPLMVVYTTSRDPRSGDDLPFGIITAFFPPPQLPCVVPGDGVHPDCAPPPPPDDPVATLLTYTGPTHGTNGQPFRLSASLVDDLGIPVEGETLHFRVGTGDAAQSCDGATNATGAAQCTIAALHQPVGSLTVTVSFSGDGDLQASSSSDAVASQSPTTLKYTGPSHAVNGRALDLSASLTDDTGSPVSNKTVHFSIGTGNAAQSCDGTTNATGAAQCAIAELRQPPASIPLETRFAGDNEYEPSSDSATLAVQSPTTLTYSGPARIANGTTAPFSAVLKDYLGTPVADRSVHFTVGSSDTEQTCEGTTGTDGTARCTISGIKQPLNNAATVPLRVEFAGDANYLASHADTTLLLEYYTGRAYGLSTSLTLPLLPPIHLAEQPDTGQVRTASATNTSPPCTTQISAIALNAKAVCANVTTTLAPGTSKATASVTTATVGLPGVPVIGVSGLTTTATSRCDGATGTTQLNLTIGGSAITVPTAPNSVISLPGGTRLVINEQQPVTGADKGIAVNGVHITAAGLADIVLGSSTSAVHNCAS